MSAPVFNSTITTNLGYTPVYRIDAGGADITGNFNDRAISITINLIDGGGAGDRVEITLDDRDFAIASPSTGLDGDGTTLTVFLGYKEGGIYEMGSYSINEVNYEGMPRSMRICGSSFGFENAGKAPLILSYEGKTLGDILNSIAESAGVSLSVDQFLAKAIPYLHQHSSSLHLLQELERRYNGLAHFADGMLSFTQRGTGLSASGEMIGGFVLRPEDFGSWSIREQGRPAYSHTRASYFDKDLQRTAWVVSSIAGPSGASVPNLLKKGYPSQDEAQAAADSKQAELNRGIHFGSITLAKGDPSIRPGQPFIIAGMRDGVDGSYVITAATHAFTKESGITTSFEFNGTGEDFSNNIPQ